MFYDFLLIQIFSFYPDFLALALFLQDLADIVALQFLWRKCLGIKDAKQLHAYWVNKSCELEKFISENNAAKWFCQFGLADKTPDHSVFGRNRNKIGASKLSKVFHILRDQLKSQGYVSEVFTFIDATHLISKATFWQERDKLIEKRLAKLSNHTSSAKRAEEKDKIIAEKLEILNNENVSKFAADKDARFGAKSEKKFWYGYKKHVPSMVLRLYYLILP